MYTDPEKVANPHTSTPVLLTVTSLRISLISDKVKNRYMQFGKLTSLGKGCNSKCAFMASQ